MIFIPCPFLLVKLGKLSPRSGMPYLVCPNPVLPDVDPRRKDIRLTHNVSGIYWQESVP